MLVRREQGSDAEAVVTVHRAAFPTSVEADLAVNLRVSGVAVPELSMVAELDGAVVGHVVCSWGALDSRPALGLGPIGVVPSHQGGGVGTALMHAVLGGADAIGEPLVALVGDPEWYCRFGFVASTEVGVAPPGPDYGRFFQVRTLAAFDPSTAGTFTYAAPFDEP